MAFLDHLPDRPPDPPSITLEQDHEIRFWTQRFGVAEPELRDLVSRYGPSPEAIDAVRAAEPKSFARDRSGAH